MWKKMWKKYVVTFYCVQDWTGAWDRDQTDTQGEILAHYSLKPDLMTSKGYWSEFVWGFLLIITTRSIILTAIILKPDVLAVFLINSHILHIYRCRTSTKPSTWRSSTKRSRRRSVKVKTRSKTQAKTFCPHPPPIQPPSPVLGKGNTFIKSDPWCYMSTFIYS